MTMRNLGALATGAVVGTLGGLIGLGGAEFRLPLLVGVFRYRVLHAIVINLVVSLATVAVSFLFRARLIPFDHVAAHWAILVNLLAGTLLGAYVGVRLSTGASERAVYRAVVVMLAALSVVLISHDWLFGGREVALSTPAQIGLGLVAGVGIGVVSSMLGVAGGELIIPTLVLLYGLDIKLAGSLSLAISVPTILVGLWRYHRRGIVAEVRSEGGFMAWMALGSAAGAFAGAWWLRFVSASFLHVFLGLILLISAGKIWLSHGRRGSG